MKTLFANAGILRAALRMTAGAQNDFKKLI